MGLGWAWSISWPKGRVCRKFSGVALHIPWMSHLEVAISQGGPWDLGWWDLNPGNRNRKRTTLGRGCTWAKGRGREVWDTCENNELKTHGWCGWCAGGEGSISLKRTPERIIIQDKTGFEDKNTWDIQKRMPRAPQLLLLLLLSESEPDVGIRHLCTGFMLGYIEVWRVACILFLKHLLSTRIMFRIKEPL